jgi:hypothetical protein
MKENNGRLRPFVLHGAVGATKQFFVAEVLKVFEIHEFASFVDRCITPAHEKVTRVFQSEFSLVNAPLRGFPGSASIGGSRIENRGLKK